MSNKGRPQKDKTPKAVKARKKAGERFRELRKANCWTQKELAEKLDRSEQAIRRYEKGTVDIPRDVSARFAELTGVNAEYLFSTHDFQRYDEYVSMDPMLSQLEDAYQEYQRRVKDLFDLLGYRFELDVEATAALRECEKGECRGDSLLFRVTPKGEPQAWFYCRDVDTRDILSSMGDVIGFWGYRKNKRIAKGK